MLKMASPGEALITPNCFERLYLLEFMVHEVCYDCAATMDQNFLNTLGPTVVTFNSDSFPPLEMSEDEFGASPPFEAMKVKFKSGKSCLFALKKGSESLISDKAHIYVARRLPPGGCSPEYKFGTAYLKLSREFLSVLSAPTTSSKCLRVSLDILNCEMATKGSIAIFLRLTCFGSTIITQFQADPSSDNRSFSFRGDNIVALDLQYNCPPSTGVPQCAGLQVQNICPDVSEKTKDELIQDLVKVIKSSTMLNILLNQTLPRRDQYSFGGFPPPHRYNKEALVNPTYSGLNVARPLNQFHQYPNFNTSGSRFYPNSFKTLFPPQQYPHAAGAVGPNPPLYEATRMPYFHNNMLTYEPTRNVEPVVSENILCKPEAHLGKVDASEARPAVASKLSPSRTSVIRRNPSKSIWYSTTGGTSQAVICKKR